MARPMVSEKIHQSVARGQTTEAPSTSGFAPRKDENPRKNQERYCNTSQYML
jgi:hypothetical protein